MEGYAVVCDSRKRQGLIGLVDRSKTKSQWWTYGDPNLLMCFEKESSAQYQADQYEMNNPAVIEFQRAWEEINHQRCIDQAFSSHGQD